MRIVVVILTIMIFIKTLSYGIYEIKNENKLGGIISIFLAIISLVLPNLVVFIRGI